MQGTAGVLSSPCKKEQPINYRSLAPAAAASCAGPECASREGGRMAEEKAPSLWKDLACGAEMLCGVVTVKESTWHPRIT